MKILMAHKSSAVISLPRHSGCCTLSLQKVILLSHVIDNSEAKTLTSNTAVLPDKPLLLCQKPIICTITYVLVSNTPCRPSEPMI